MENTLYDNRCSLWEIGIRQQHIGNYIYLLQGPPERGGSCMVYPVLKQEWVGEKVYERRVLLKEFYPILDVDGSAGIKRREDGSLHIPKATQNSEGYQTALKRFHEAYGVMLELGKTESGAEHTSVPLALMEACGTWYMEEAYDTGISFSEFFAKKKSSFSEFLDMFEKCLQAVSRLHSLGYYHMDLKPQNVSSTNSGIVKLFDTDSFIKKEDLGNCPILLETEGFSAPELRGAVYEPEDAAFLIGPWTDIFSLAQFICWYLYGHPLEEDELEEKLEHLQEKIENSFGGYPPKISRKGLYRLKLFLLKALSRHHDMRHQSIEEAIEQIKEIHEYLFYDKGEPIDNFQESTELLWGYENELAQLEKKLFGKGTCVEAAAVLIGDTKEEREKVARYYATLHRLDYSDIVEIHCKDFGKLKKHIRWPMFRYGKKHEQKRELHDIQCPHEKPILFLIFDEQEKNIFSSQEARELNKLMNVFKSHVLIVGHYDRFMNKLEEFDDIIPVINLEFRKIVQEIKGFVDKVNENGGVPRGSWKKRLFRGIFGIFLLAAGVFCSMRVSAAAGNVVEYDRILDLFKFSSGMDILAIVWMHVLAVSLMMLGGGIVVYCLYEWENLSGWRHFIEEHRWTILGQFSAIFSVSIPSCFPFFSLLKMTQGLGRQWSLLESCMNGLEKGVILLGVITLLIWSRMLISHPWKSRKNLTALSFLLFAVSVVYVFVQTFANLWEFGVFLVFVMIGCLYRSKY